MNPTETQAFDIEAKLGLPLEEIPRRGESEQGPAIPEAPTPKRKPTRKKPPRVVHGFERTDAGKAAGITVRSLHCHNGFRLVHVTKVKI